MPFDESWVQKLFGKSHTVSRKAFATRSLIADRFVTMWVNDLTLDYTDRGREAVQRILTEGFERGIIPNLPTVEFAL